MSARGATRELEAKFRDLAATELAPREIETLVEQCWSLAQLPDAGVLARGSVSSRKRE